MIKRISKKSIFLFSLIIVGMFGLIQNILKDNFTKSGSSFQKENISLTPDMVQKVYADVITATPGDSSDGSGDGSNGF